MKIFGPKVTEKHEFEDQDDPIRISFLVSWTTTIPVAGRKSITFQSSSPAQKKLPIETLMQQTIPID